MAHKPDQDLSRRERQIMEILYREGEASVAEVVDGLPDPPSDTAVRTLLRILQRKGYVRRDKAGRKHVYRSSQSRTKAARAALTGVLSTFFGGSLGEAVAAHLADPSSRIERAELTRLTRLIEEAKKGEC